MSAQNKDTQTPEDTTRPSWPVNAEHIDIIDALRTRVTNTLAIVVESLEAGDARMAWLAMAAVERFFTIQVRFDIICALHGADAGKDIVDNPEAMKNMVDEFTDSEIALGSNIDRSHTSLPLAI